MLMMSIISMVISTAMITINTFIASKKKSEREKPSPFECGFDPKSSSRLPFSLQFYLIAVIFLIFDVEITLIMPLPITFKLMNFYYWTLLLITFLLILLLGLFHEWNQGALQWKF
nr:NADH dehydrogenase subunit 3 [Aphaenomurus interpositus]